MSVVPGYFALLSTATAMAAGGTLPPGLAMWVPVIALAAVTAWAMGRAALDLPLLPSRRTPLPASEPAADTSGGSA